MFWELWVEHGELNIKELCIISCPEAMSRRIYEDRLLFLETIGEMSERYEIDFGR